MDDRSGRRVLRFAVTGALLGGGVAAAGCPTKHPVNPAPMLEPSPEDEPDAIGDSAVADDPAPSDEAGPAEETPPAEPEPEPPDVNPGPR